MNKKPHFRHSLVALAVGSALTLAGCGDSGGSGSSDTEETFSATSTGVASKGILQNAQVTAEELDSSGNVLREVGTAETGEDGRYSLTIGENYENGPIQLSLTAQDGTEMKCDFKACVDGDTARGDWFEPGDDFELQAVLPGASSGDTVKAQITPFTTMASSRARTVSGGTVDGDAVRKANSETNQLVGVDILSTEPVDSTDLDALEKASPEAKIYSSFNAGAGALATGDDSKSLGQGIKDLKDSFEDGKLDDTDAVKPADFVNSVKDEAADNDSPFKDDADVSNSVATLEGSVGDDGSLDPEPVDSTTLSQVEQAKGLVQDVRDWGTSFAELESPARAFGGDLDTAEAVFNDEVSAQATLLQRIADAVALKLEGMTSTDLGSTETVNVKNSSGDTLGSVDLTTQSRGSLGGVSASVSDNGDFSNLDDVSLTFDTDLPARLIDGDSADLDEANVQVSGAIASSKASLSLDQFDVSSTLQETTTVGGNSTSEPTPATADFSGDVTIEAGGHQFNGVMGLSFVELTSNAHDSSEPNPVSLKEVSLSGDFLAVGGTNQFTADASLTMANAASFDTIAFLNYEPDVWVEGYEVGDKFGATDHYSGSLHSYQYSEWDSQTCFSGGNGDYCESGDFLKIKDALETHYGNEYSETITAVDNVHASYYGSETYWGAELEFADFESASNFADFNAELNVDLTLDGHPGASAAVTADRTGLEAGTLIVTLTQDGQSLKFNASEPASGAAELTVTTPDGGKLVMTEDTADDTVIGSVSVDGNEIGTLKSTEEGLVTIRYEDGTFETLQ